MFYSIYYGCLGGRLRFSSVLKSKIGGLDFAKPLVCNFAVDFRLQRYRFILY